MRRPFERAIAVKDSPAYCMWALRNRFCHACGIPFYKAGKLRYPGLQNHHMVKSHRSDEFCNLLRLCGWCHSLAENQEVIYNGEPLPHIGLAVALMIKKWTDPEAWNPMRLEELYHRPLPEPKPVPIWFDQEWMVWQKGKERGEI